MNKMSTRKQIKNDENNSKLTLKYVHCTVNRPKVFYFCVGFREFSHLTHDLSQVEKKINVVTS